MCFAELSAAMPQTGGTYVFLRRAYNSELIPFAFAWMICFAYGTGAIAVVAIMAGTFLVPVLGIFGVDIAEYVNETAVVLIVLLTLLNSRGVRHGGLAQNVLTALKVSLVLLGSFSLPPWASIAFLITSSGSAPFAFACTPAATQQTNSPFSSLLMGKPRETLIQ